MQPSVRYCCLCEVTTVCSMYRKILYEWINAFGKSFYTVNIKRIESLKHDAGCASFGSLDSSDIHTGLADGETSVQCGGEERSAADRKSSTAGFDHLSSTIVTYHSSGDIDKDPNVVVRTMKRALKKVSMPITILSSFSLFILIPSETRKIWMCFGVMRKRRRSWALMKATMQPSFRFMAQRQ